MLRRSLLAVVGVVFIAWSGWCGHATANTIYVPGRPTIQAAIDATSNGDVIVVTPGTYKETLDFKGKVITVRGTDPFDPAVVAATIIDGDHLGSVVTFASAEMPTSILSGLTITNGTGTTVTHPSGFKQVYGGGIYCTGSSPTIQCCVIRGNSASGAGGGVFSAGGSPLIQQNLITGNKAGTGTPSGTGGGLYCQSGSPIIQYNTITANSGGNAAGGVYLNTCSFPLLVRNTITNNTAAAAAGGVSVASCTGAFVEYNTISGNTRESGGRYADLEYWHGGCLQHRHRQHRRQGRRCGHLLPGRQ